MKHSLVYMFTACCLSMLMFSSLESRAANTLGDVDDNGSVEITDAITLINYVLDIISCDVTPLPHPVDSASLKVLSLGNSFAFFSTKYLTDLATAAGIPSSLYRIRVLHPQGRSLQQWASEIEANGTVSLMTDIGTAPVHGAGGNNIRNILNNDWDVIVLQQNSDNASNYSTYEPYLSEIVDAIHEYCPNRDVLIAWHMIWSKPGKNWSDIKNATYHVSQNENIDFIIPVGTAIENARYTDVWTGVDGGLMNDNNGHLAPGVGQYVSSCAWFQALLAPYFGKTIVGNTAVRTQEQVDAEWNALSNKTHPDSKIAVTEENRTLCQYCAAVACTNVWSLTTKLDSSVVINMGNADVNQDGFVNITDVCVLINDLLNNLEA